MLHTLKKEASLKGVGLGLKGEGSCCMGAQGPTSARGSFLTGAPLGCSREKHD